MNTPQPPAREQSAEDILSAISFEIEHTQKTSEQLGRDKARGASALAIDVLIQIMLYDSDNRTRRAAAKDILEFVYGSSASRAPLVDASQDLYDKIFEQITCS